MQLHYLPYQLLFKHPFGVSGNTRTQTTSVFVKIEWKGLLGYGEACLPPYLGETEEGTILFLEKVKPTLKNYTSPSNLEEVLIQIDALSPNHHAAKASVDIALHDLWAKSQQKPLRVCKNNGGKNEMPTSFTIGIDSEEKIKQKIEEARDFEILKIKAGTANDNLLLETVRKYTQKPIYVDVNQGWKDKQYALEMAQWMSTQNVVLLEQPMPKEMHAEMCWLTERSPIPTFADESIKRFGDLQKMENAFSGINIKLMKSTGLHEASKMIDYCKQKGIKILLGCMAESSCATTAMAQLMHHADFIDLDAPQLYLNDPFTGVEYQNGKVLLNDLPGIGVLPKMDFGF